MLWTLTEHVKTRYSCYGCFSTLKIKKLRFGYARLMFKAFGDAKDRWKIDGATMKAARLPGRVGPRSFITHRPLSSSYLWFIYRIL